MKLIPTRRPRRAVAIAGPVLASTVLAVASRRRLLILGQFLVHPAHRRHVVFGSGPHRARRSR